MVCLVVPAKRTTRTGCLVFTPLLSAIRWRKGAWGEFMGLPSVIPVGVPCTVNTDPAEQVFLPSLRRREGLGVSS